MAEVQIYSGNNTLPNGYKKGDVLFVYPNGYWDGSEVWSSPNSVYLKIPDADEQFIKDNFLGSWVRNLTFDSTWYPAVKGYRVTITAENISILENNVNYGKITKDMVETYLNNWGCTVYEFGDNSVTFDAYLFNVCTSKKFFGRELNNVTFTEIGWNATTYNMTIDVDITNIDLTILECTEILEELGCTIVGSVDNEESRVIRYRINRSIINTTFKDTLNKSYNSMLYRRQSYLGSGAVDAIIANGGVAEYSKSTVLNYVKDRLTDT